MKTQKGIKSTDVIVLIGENKAVASFSVAFPNCEKFTVEKHYEDEEDFHRKFDTHLDDFIGNLSSTVFTVEADDDEGEVNDSWGAIMGDLFQGAKKKFNSIKG